VENSQGNRHLPAAHGPWTPAGAFKGGCRMKQSEWRRAYAPDPVRLEARVRHTLKNLDAAPAARPRMLRTALIAALVLALLGGIALAVYESRTADLAGWFGGEERKEELLSGDIAPSGEST